jgi:hypothetical protein
MPAEGSPIVRPCPAGPTNGFRIHIVGGFYAFPLAAMIFSMRMRPRRILPTFAKHAISNGEYALRVERLKSDHSSSVTGFDQGD